MEINLLSANPFRQAKRHCQNYLQKLHTAGVKFPHKTYDIGAIALNSCWWALIADHNSN